METLIIKKSEQLTVKTNEWLIEDVIPLRSLCFLSAPPKLGKTMVALELSTALCTGKAAFGIYPIPKVGRVLYFAGEDAEGGFKKRVDSFTKAKLGEVTPIELYTVVEQRLLIDTEEGKLALCAAIEEVKPQLLVLDNLSRVHHSNENSAALMNLIFEFLQHIKLKYGISVLLIHHMGKDGTLRGSSQIDSYYEAAIFLKAKDEQRFMDFKFRNYEERVNVPYRIGSTNDELSFVLGDGGDTQSNIISVRPSFKVMTYDIDESLRNGDLIRYPSGAIGWKKRGN